MTSVSKDFQPPSKLTDALPKHMFARYWQNLASDLTQYKIVVFDAETTNKDKGSAINRDNNLVLLCWQVMENGKLRKHYHFGDEYSQQAFVRDISDASAVVAHNAKFDLQWLSR